MDHNFIRHKLSEYIDGTVSAAEKAEIETHLKACEKCSDALRELQKTIEHVRQINEIEPPAWMTQKIMAKVRVEAEQQKSFLERLYSVFVVNLPVKAVA
ncbi:MAG TPA: zf-HC2 domain-containing protein, partial [Nitrospirota bacterium]|nr:zf-HC2 domain-containing protein [Nitrospirota bacterium]